MTPRSAFSGNQNQKDALIADIEAGGLLTRLWLAGQDRRWRFDVLATEFDVDAGLLHLAAALAPNPQEEAMRTFAAGLVRRLPPGADTTGFAQRFYLHCWSEAGWAIEPRLHGSAAHAPGRAIIDLVRDSRSAPIAPTVWRKARRALDASAVRPEDAATIDVLREMAWDLSESTGPVADVVTALGRLQIGDSHRENDWSPELAEQANDRRMALWRAASEEVGTPTDPNDKMGHFTKVQTKFAEMAHASEHAALIQRGGEYDQMAFARLSAWMSAAREAVLMLVERLAVPADKAATAA